MDSSDICDISKYTSNGKTVTWEVTCSQKKLPVQNGHFQYSDKTFSGRIIASAPDSNNTITTLSNGRFLTSDCTKRDSEEVLSKINQADHAQ